MSMDESTLPGRDTTAPKSDSDRADPGDNSATLNATSIFAAAAAARTPSKSPSKSRSLSDSTPTLSPSPKFREPARLSKDDHTIVSSSSGTPGLPRIPRRPDFLARGLSLQMPPRESTPTSLLTGSRGAPLSPQLDAHTTYATPATVLPRHSRGLDFARACTNLHHSTLAEQSSPDSSPTVTQKGSGGGMMIPQRRNHRNSASMMDSPAGGIGVWSMGGGDKMTVASSSLGSVNMLGSDSDSSSSDNDDIMESYEPDDPIVNTPQVLKLNNAAFPSPFGLPSLSSPSGGWTGSGSPAAPTASLMNYQRARLRKAKSRHSSSSASAHSSMASPGPGSPPQGKSYEGNSGGYFAREVVKRNAGSRRESLSMVTNDLHISSGNDSGDELRAPGVVRRPVTRRGNLLPKTRAFGRIRAELLEESAPIDSEVKREAEVIRQVRESDPDDRPQSSTANSSPSLLPAVPGANEVLEDIPEDGAMGLDSESGTGAKGLFGAFSLQASKNRAGPSFWNRFDTQMQTPPPPTFPRGEPSATGEDVSMDSPSVSSSSMTTGGIFNQLAQNGNNGPNDSSMKGPSTEPSRASTPQPNGSSNPFSSASSASAARPSAVEGIRKANKRRRDDDFDISSIKRRAVSPSISVQNSPILSQSPGQRESIWSQATKRESTVSASSGGGHAAGERSNSGASSVSTNVTTPALGPKRVGMQGMTDTNDGLMKMTIE
ncbi:hypothetical protein BDY21DRAFT_117999 [Lineolata rhizophorae]|uniref:Uncharacterized protein n=1 Tax=Lineolata rhizophorae TaxID=578093 RepID=A0A6A6NPU9_9PEZI|nr:hypothetical protein BDY21DRAFT_117999 [Lineolata rhizophorae]